MPPPSAAASQHPVFNADRSLVQVCVRGRSYNHLVPGGRPQLHSWTGSGVVIGTKGKKYILTNAHVATNAVQIVIKFRDATQYTCQTVFTGHDGDLSMLEVVETPHIFNEKAEGAVLWEGQYTLGQEISIHGFSGGKYRIKKGIVNGIDEDIYVHFKKVLELVSVDADINHGDSGGCGEIDGLFAGIPFQSWHPSVKQRSGHIIPISVIKHFLKEFELGAEYQGFPVLGISLQPLENPILRAYYQWNHPELGMLVNEQASGTGLKEGDIVFEIDGKPLSSAGKVILGVGQSTSYGRYIDTKFVGDSIELKIKRFHDKNLYKVTIKLKSDAENPMPVVFDDTPPSYLVVPPLVLQELESRYVEDYMTMRKKVPEKLMHALSVMEREPHKRLVFVSIILPCAWGEGYDDSYREVPLYSINDMPIFNLKHFLSITDTVDDRLFKIKMMDGKVMVIPNLKKYQIDEFSRILRENEFIDYKSRDLSEDLSIMNVSERKGTSRSTKMVGVKSPTQASCLMMSSGIEEEREIMGKTSVVASVASTTASATAQRSSYNSALARFVHDLQSAQATFPGSIPDNPGTGQLPVTFAFSQLNSVGFGNTLSFDQGMPCSGTGRSMVFRAGHWG